MRESRFQDRRERRQKILTKLALLPADERKQNQRQRRQKAENIEKPCHVLRERKQISRQKRQKAEYIDKPCPASCRGPVDGRKQHQ
jgi:hypothetical protein